MTILFMEWGKTVSAHVVLYTCVLPNINKMAGCAKNLIAAQSNIKRFPVFLVCEGCLSDMHARERNLAGPIGRAQW